MQLFVNIATLVTAAAALFVILEMRWQRQSGYKPDLLVTGFAFNLKELELGVFSDGTEEIADAMLHPKYFRSECANVGVGYAKSIQLFWQYDALAFIARIAHLDPKIGAAIQLDSGMLQIEKPMRVTHMVSNQNHAAISFIAPGSTIAIPRIPNAYIDLLQIYMSTMISAVSDGSGVYDLEFEELSLTIDYLDIGSQRRQQRFVFRPQIHSLTGRAPEKKHRAEVRGNFEVSEA